MSAADVAPSNPPTHINGQSVHAATQDEGPSIAPDNACDEPSPSAPNGAGAGAIAQDANGKDYDKVYGVRPKTTWHLKPRAEMSLWEGIAAIDTCPPDTYRKRREDEKRGPPPVQPTLPENVFIILTGAIAPTIHFVWNKLFPDRLMHWAPAFVVYHLSFIVFAQLLIRRLHAKMDEFGVFDEQNRGRDMVDDQHVNRLGRSIFIYTALRTVQPFIAKWRGDMANPFDGLSVWTPVKIAVWEIALDYWFYLYHRSTHEFDSLWWVHRQHHATKHPTPILSILADDVQECIEILIVPVLATICAPRLNFPEFHYAIMYTLYVEALGHSGIRAVWQHPLLGPILKPFGMELAVEDHDLHHRFGRSGKNYGKQTRVWDRIFGTIGERIETPK
ncbi:hypothetical protein CF319_g4979 [Tilletia indica]|uniref:Fatty acid hydroxylase domain-containing protein n=2 Tax=Tilletia TaxID=13289 RepID=A0A8X7NB90_9BASI|nr:hypothetical protein CF327_g4566 [Tilletia walkeri]KAE8221710.1 hypothetical protein CF319_g4979 [Tilletia indica]KAE8234889.1 hypothetical protein CF326_g54 [Tilletia indica]KAE8259064.1 hypothetical protein A4X13_0g1258 [Tilletia indica]KAE8269777.1 hypothetical protein A4X09_0g2577 [Tilletia walkeri]